MIHCQHLLNSGYNICCSTNVEPCITAVITNCFSRSVQEGCITTLIPTAKEYILVPSKMFKPWSDVFLQRGNGCGICNVISMRQRRNISCLYCKKLVCCYLSFSQVLSCFMVYGPIVLASYLMGFICCLTALLLWSDSTQLLWPDGRPPEHFLMGLFKLLDCHFFLSL